MDIVNKEDCLPHGESSPGPPTLIEYMLDFGYVPQGSQKTLQQVIVNNTKKPMIWLADFDESRWLTVQPDHGILQPGGQQSIRITADTRALEVGKHSVTLTFSSEGDETSMSTDTITKVMVKAPHKALAPRPLEAGLDFGGLTQQSTRTLRLVIGNPDNRPVKWRIQIGFGKPGIAVRETLEHGEKPAGIKEKISITEDNGIVLSESKGTLAPNEFRTIDVTVNAAKLDNSYAYTTNLTLISKAAGTASTSVKVPIVFYVNRIPYNDGGPKVPPDWPANINITIPHRSANGTFRLSFTNNNDNPPRKVYWSLKSDASWLIPTPSSGNFDADVTDSVVLTAQRTVGMTAGVPVTTDLQLTLAWDPAMTAHTIAKSSVILSVQ